jgi:hypothetical protein
MRSKDEMIAEAEGLRKERRFDAAESLLAEALAAFGESIELLLSRAWVALQSGKCELALDRWARVRVVAARSV